jgi:hypothetical protein
MSRSWFGARASRPLEAAGTAALLMIPVLSPAFAAETIPQPVALLQGLDKTTARVSKFEAKVGTEVRFGTLSVWVRACEKNPPEEAPDNAAFVEIFENRPGEAKAKLFSGWMFSSSPALSALEHAVYDVNLLECKGAPPPAPSPAAPSTPAPPSGRSRGNTPR